MIFLIALLPAVVVLLVGLFSRKKGPTLTAAILGSILGAVTGNPIYMALDIICIVVAYLMASSTFKKAQ